MEGTQGRHLGDAAQVKPFNIMFITQEDPFYVRIFFEEFLRNYPRREEIKAVVIAPTMGKSSLAGLARQMYDFYGARDFFKVGFRYAYYKGRNFLAPLLPAKRFYSIRQVCEHYGVPVRHAPDINGEDFLSYARQLDLDLVISVAAPQVFKAALIAVPKQGCINIHNAKLPKYRGMLPNFWQMYHGERNVGTSIHRINAKIDDGDIVLQRETPIQPGETLDALIVRTKKFGAQLMIEAIAGLKNGSLQPIANSSAEATYFGFPSRRDVSEFRRKGYRLI
jgi:methionyl-tRNA formyltransferase